MFKFDPSIQYYKNRAGQKIGPVTKNYSYPEYYLDLDGRSKWFGNEYSNGKFAGRCFLDYEWIEDLIEPWVEATGDKKVAEKKLIYRQAIEPGEYGIVFIQMDSDGDYSVSIEEGFHSYQDILDAAEILKELGEFIKNG